MQQEPHPQLAASFGLHASLTLSDATLAAAVAAASDLARDGHPCGFHIHGAEAIADVEDSLAKSGLRAIARLGAAGILGPQTIVAHAVHVDAAEIALLAETGTWVTHQPRSNMNNAVGFAHVEAMLDQGVKIALGNDGFSNNMIAEMKTAYLTHKLVQRDPRAMPADLVIRMAYESNGALARIFWPQQQLGVRMSEPEPPRSKPRSVSSLKTGSKASVTQPKKMMSPVDPWKLVKPEPCFSQMSQSLRRMSEV